GVITKCVAPFFLALRRRYATRPSASIDSLPRDTGARAGGADARWQRRLLVLAQSSRRALQANKAEHRGYGAWAHILVNRRAEVLSWVVVEAEIEVQGFALRRPRARPAFVMPWFSLLLLHAACAKDSSTAGPGAGGTGGAHQHGGAGGVGGAAATGTSSA